MIKLTNSNRPAFPLTEETTDRVEYEVDIYTGLTKREYFAAMAMQGLCNTGAYSKSIIRQCIDLEVTTAHAIAVYAVDIADELLKQLEQGPSTAPAYKTL